MFKNLRIYADLKTRNNAVSKISIAKLPSAST